MTELAAAFSRLFPVSREVDVCASAEKSRQKSESNLE